MSTRLADVPMPGTHHPDLSRLARATIDGNGPIHTIPDDAYRTYAVGGTVNVPYVTLCLNRVRAPMPYVGPVQFAEWDVWAEPGAFDPDTGSWTGDHTRWVAPDRVYRLTDPIGEFMAGWAPASDERPR